MKMVFPEYLDVFSQEHKDKLQNTYGIEFFTDTPQTDEEILQRVGDAEVLILKWMHLTDEILEKFPNLKYIVSLTAGYNQLPLKRARELGITVINCPTHNSNAVVEHVFALLLAVSRNIVIASNQMQKGEWKKTPTDLEGVELTGKKLLLIGNGRIGKGVAHIAEAFGMEVSATDSKTTPEQLDEFIKSADVVSIHVRLMESTMHLMDKRRLELMKPSAFLINTARGEVVDQQALREVLLAGKIAGAGLDVFENEPAESPISDELKQLVALPNVVATPHIAYSTKESGIRLGAELLSNLENLTVGSPINVVN